jgi:hypothetical protein
MQEFIIGDDEMAKECPFCKYFEIWPKMNDMGWFFCQRPNCGKMSCNICYHEMPVA